jgi:tight adherence protein C
VPIVLALVFGLAAALAAITIVTIVAERSETRRSLRALEGYHIAVQRDQEMLATFGDRVLSPLGKSVSGAVNKWTPTGYRQKLERKVLQAGSPPGLEVDRLLMLKAVGTASVVLWYPLIFLFLKESGMIAFLMFGVLWGGSFMLPEITLDRKVDERKSAIARKLPDVLDLLVISVEAGLAFEQALERTANSVPGPLSDEFRRMLQESRLGSGRAEALRAMDERCDVPELRSFVMALLQADTFGVSIGKILRAQADEMRIRRRLTAQEKAQKAPVKMLFPLVLCIFPAVFVIVLGPALITITKSL